MNDKCEICNQIKSGTVKKIYEDDDLIAILDENPFSDGHVLMMPKEHYPIFENVPDETVEKLAHLTNKLSTVVFEALGVQGTNVLINNGIDAGQEFSHFMINLIPRKEGDKIDFNWKTKQLTVEEMSTIELNLKNETSSVGVFDTKKEPEKFIQEEPQVIETEDEDENYLIKHIKRIP